MKENKTANKYKLIDYAADVGRPTNIKSMSLGCWSATNKGIKLKQPTSINLLTVNMQRELWLFGG